VTVALAVQEQPKTPPEQDPPRAGDGKDTSTQGKGNDQDQSAKKKVVQVSARRKPVPPTVDTTATADAMARAAERLHRTPGDFTVVGIPGSPILYNFTLWETSQRASVTLMVNISQLRVFLSIMEAANKFAAEAEGVGKTKPLTTRFYDDNDPSFFVDVAKLGTRSQFFITVKSREASVTLDAGTLKRGEANQPTFFDAMRARMLETIDKPPSQN
jgi:hypothetical protein